MYLCIDWGNSRVKTGIFDQEGHLMHTAAFTDNALKGIKNLIELRPVKHLIVSVTGKKDWDIADLKVEGIRTELDANTSLPISIIYKTPHTLGRDRIASACGANALYPGKTCLIIDAGTCVTSDVVLSSGIFIGGNIAPGINMRLEAMHEKTARLPLVPPGFPENQIGDSTLHALQNGACLGAVMEIEGILNRVKDAYGEVLVVITGGDAALLATKLECQIFVEPELVIQGLFQILSFNVKNPS